MPLHSNMLGSIFCGQGRCTLRAVAPNGLLQLQASVPPCKRSCHRLCPQGRLVSAMVSEAHSSGEAMKRSCRALGTAKPLQQAYLSVLPGLNAAVECRDARSVQWFGRALPAAKPQLQCEPHRHGPCSPEHDAWIICGQRVAGHAHHWLLRTCLVTVFRLGLLCLDCLAVSSSICFTMLCDALHIRSKLQGLPLWTFLLERHLQQSRRLTCTACGCGTCEALHRSDTAAHFWTTPVAVPEGAGNFKCVTKRTSCAKCRNMTLMLWP